VQLYCKLDGENSSALGEEEIPSLFISLHFSDGSLSQRQFGHPRKKGTFDLREQSNPCMSKEAGQCSREARLLPE